MGQPGARVAVLTASVPERALMLAECVASVRAQTRPAAAHLIVVDHERAGCVASMNGLLAAVHATGCDWVALLADDDLIDPGHIETLLAHAAGADIVYSWCRVEGRPGWNPNTRFDPSRLRHGNYIPSTSMIRVELALRLGGWAEDAAHGFEDWDFWLRALDADARFVCVPAVTWTYRFHGGNASWR